MKIIPRRERPFPRVLSKNFPNGFTQCSDMCYIPLSDYRKLEKRYIQLFRRYKRK